jgi:hypothetical protein
MRFNLSQKLAALALLMSVSGLSLATGPDWSVLTNAIQFGTLSTGLLAAGAALVGVFIAIKGVKIIVGMVRS